MVSRQLWKQAWVNVPFHINEGETLKIDTEQMSMLRKLKNSSTPGFPGVFFIQIIRYNGDIHYMSKNMSVGLITF